MNRELIKIEIIENNNREKIQVVRGRDLHEFLELNTRYNDWVKRMIGYGFLENRDFQLVTQKRVTNNPKNPWTSEEDHIMTLDMAKHIAMIQRTDKAMQARQYFIDCEKEFQKIKQEGLYVDPNKVDPDLLIAFAKDMKKKNRKIAKLTDKNKDQRKEITSLKKANEKLDRTVRKQNMDIELRDERITNLSPKGKFYDTLKHTDMWKPAKKAVDRYDRERKQVYEDIFSLHDDDIEWSE